MDPLVDLKNAVSDLLIRVDRAREDNYSRLFDALGVYMESVGEGGSATILTREAQALHQLQAKWEVRDCFKDPFDYDEEDEEDEEGIDVEDEEAHWYAPI